MCSQFVGCWVSRTLKWSNLPVIIAKWAIYLTKHMYRSVVCHFWGQWTSHLNSKQLTRTTTFLSMLIFSPSNYPQLRILLLTAELFKEKYASHFLYFAFHSFLEMKKICFKAFLFTTEQ